ncbi:uncharacterized protein LOC143153479 [Ptiloglossa arizonensis]|uniref:uncharacterized protein LOC143153479 n=1 Tax=Ptiloglossa arizonensis TaxID=3350558 RepID=UPI003FA16150
MKEYVKSLTDHNMDFEFMTILVAVITIILTIVQLEIHSLKTINYIYVNYMYKIKFVDIVQITRNIPCMKPHVYFYLSITCHLTLKWHCGVLYDTNIPAIFTKVYSCLCFFQNYNF